MAKEFNPYFEILNKHKASSYIVNCSDDNKITYSSFSCNDSGKKYGPYHLNSCTAPMRPGVFSFDCEMKPPPPGMPGGPPGPKCKLTKLSNNPKVEKE